jgi:hypothetical protein
MEGQTHQMRVGEVRVQLVRHALRKVAWEEVGEAGLIPGMTTDAMPLCLAGELLGEPRNRVEGDTKAGLTPAASTGLA